MAFFLHFKRQRDGTYEVGPTIIIESPYLPFVVFRTSEIRSFLINSAIYCTIFNNLTLLLRGTCNHNHHLDPFPLGILTYHCFVVVVLLLAENTIVSSSFLITTNGTLFKRTLFCYFMGLVISIFNDLSLFGA